MTLELTNSATHNIIIKSHSRIRDFLGQLEKKIVCKIVRISYIIAEQKMSITQNNITNSRLYNSDVLEEFENKSSL